jgi:hypothetical protein
MHYLHDLDPFNLPDDRVSMRHGTVLHEFSPTLRGSRVEVDALPVIAREFATRHVEAFLRRALCGALSPTTP